MTDSDGQPSRNDVTVDSTDPFLTADDPPACAVYRQSFGALPADAKPGDGIPHPNFGIELKEAVQ